MEINTKKKTIKKLLSVVLTTSITITSFASVVQASAQTIDQSTTQVVTKAQTTASEPENKTNEIVISNKNEFSEFMNSPLFWESNARVTLSQDIDMQCETFKPIEYFSGEFDGCGHVVSNLVIEDSPKELAFIKTIDSEAKFQNVTFEKYVIRTNVAVVWVKNKNELAGFVNKNQGIISNVKFRNSEIGRGDIFFSEHGSLYNIVSGFVNENYGTIENCNSIINIDNMCVYAGGFVYTNLGNIVSCESKGNMNLFLIHRGDVATSAGGFVYENQGTIKDSKSEVSVICEEYAGGFCSKNEGEILTSESKGNVRASAMVHTNMCGGFVGENSGKVKDCSAIGYASGEECVGGFAGVNKSNIINCHASGKAVAKTDSHATLAGGFVGKNEKGTIISCIATGGAVANSNSGQAKAGGFVGVNKAIITDSKATGYVYLSAGTLFRDNGCGGFVGQNAKNGNINGCYAEATVETTYKKKGGGFVGEAKKKSTIKNSTCKSTVVLKYGKTKKADFCYDKSKKAVIENCKAK